MKKSFQLLFVWLVTSSVGLAVEPIDYDHFNVNADRSVAREMKPGDVVTVTVTNTCDKFEVASKPIKKLDESKTEQPGSNMGLQAMISMFATGQQTEIDWYSLWLKELAIECIVLSDPQKLVITHEKQYGGYVISISRKADGTSALAYRPAAKDTSAAKTSFNKAVSEAIVNKLGDVSKLSQAEKNKKTLETFNKLVGSVENATAFLKKAKLGEIKRLNNTDVLLSVNEARWRTEFAGAFTVSDLVDQKFAIETRDVDGTDTQFVIRDKQAEDEANLGVGGFVHLYHSNSPNWALSFGLGGSNDSGLSYYLGPSWRLGGQAFITAGMMFGKTDRLKTGQKLEAEPVGPDALQDLPTKTDSGFFIGISYSFLGSNAEAALKKPFADVKADTPKPEVKPAEEVKPDTGTAAPATDSPQSNNFSSMANSTAAAMLPNESQDLRKKALALLQDWANAWSEKDLDSYFSAYSESFRGGSVNHSKWKGVRAEKIRNKACIDIGVRDQAIRLLDRNSVSVTFQQVYRSDTYADVMNKELVIREFSGGTLGIVSEGPDLSAGDGAGRSNRVSKLSC